MTTAAIFSTDPLIVHTAVTQELPLGVGSLFLDEVGPYPATFLISPTWSIAQPADVRRLHEAARQARARCREHEFIFLCNEEEARALLVGCGEHAVLASHNILVSERFFRPLDDVPIEYDAIYNARFVAWKRHELARAIPRVAYLAVHIDRSPEDAEAARRLISAALAKDGHDLINRQVEGLPVRLPPAEVNRAYNRAAVGLCLSAVEGAMYASIESLLSGLPIVSTPSRGGRDVFFDPDYCMIADPDAQSVARAVAEMKARALRREDVRMRTLEKIEVQRRLLLSLLNDVVRRRGGGHRFGPEWPFLEQAKVMRWKPLPALVCELREAVGARPSAAGSLPLSPPHPA